MTKKVTIEINLEDLVQVAMLLKGLREKRDNYFEDCEQFEVFSNVTKQVESQVPSEVEDIISEGDL